MRRENVAHGKKDRIEATGAGGYVVLREAEAGHWVVVGGID